jgi:hypothetical protein
LVDAVNGRLHISHEFPAAKVWFMEILAIFNLPAKTVQVLTKSLRILARPEVYPSLYAVSDILQDMTGALLVVILDQDELPPCDIVSRLCFGFAFARPLDSSVRISKYLTRIEHAFGVLILAR